MTAVGFDDDVDVAAQSQPVTQLVNGEICLSLGYSGDMTGLTRETVNRHIRAWEAKGILRRENGTLVLLDAAMLTRVTYGASGNS